MKLIAISIFIFMSLVGCAATSEKTSKPAVAHKEGIDRDAVLSAIRSEKVAIQNCYENELKKDKSLSGTVRLKWQIDGLGVARYVHVTKSSLQNENIHKCMVNTIAKIKYPKPPKGVLGEVAIPFTFGK